MDENKKAVEYFDGIDEKTEKKEKVTRAKSCCYADANGEDPKYIGYIDDNGKQKNDFACFSGETNPAVYFGAYVLDCGKMSEMLSDQMFAEYKEVVSCRREPSQLLLKSVAEAMKKFAEGEGATHYSFRLHPTDEIRAEKREAFIRVQSLGGAIAEFGVGNLTKGEPDALAFPSVGERNRFEGRGHITWDYTSPAYVKDGALHIPAVFCSYDGMALDEKKPLLRSVELLNNVAKRLLACIGDTVQQVGVHVGIEQEYFLVDHEKYESRRDLALCGRTLFGKSFRRNSGGVIYDDSYFRARVSAFTRDLDKELWKFGIGVKTEHNERELGQYELATAHVPAVVACENNSLMMEVMQDTARKNGLACVLHEKPFDGMAGSGKHIGWSLITDSGENLLCPGKTPAKNMRFLLILAAILRAVDKNQGLIRYAAASAANDLRLGSEDAPPNVVSFFLGTELTEILDSIVDSRPAKLTGERNIKIGSTCIPPLPQNNTDSNRLSPLAFVGDRIEFRMSGSSATLFRPVYILNTIIADALASVCDRLEKSKDTVGEIEKIIKEYTAEHKKIIYNGNNYSDDWERDARERKLLSVRDTFAATTHRNSDENIGFFAGLKIFSPAESLARTEIMHTVYANALGLEARLMKEIASRQILPAAFGYLGSLSETLSGLKNAVVKNNTLVALVSRLSAAAESVSDCINRLARDMAKADAETVAESRAREYSHNVKSRMEELRAACDVLEQLVPDDRLGRTLFANL